MAIYTPPTEILTIFNQDNYLVSGDYLTIGVADKRYLRLSGGTLTGLLTASDGIYSTLYSAADGSDTAPTYTFQSDTGVGMFMSAGGALGLAWGSASIMQIDSVAGIKLTQSGDVTFPQYSFISDSQTGIYRPGSQQVGVSCNATSIQTWSSTATSTLKPILMPNGTAGSPSLSFTNSGNTGIYRVGSDVLGLSAASSLIAQVSASAFSAKQLTITNTSAYANQSVSTSGAFMNVIGNTITATNNSDMAFSSFLRPTLAASGTQTTSAASTVYIEASPLAGTNETITSPYALLVGSPGVVRILDTTASNGSTTGALQVLGGIYAGSTCRFNSNLTFQGASSTLSMTGATSSISVSGTTASSSSATGCVKLSGGLGISNTTDATDSTNGGSFTTAGGMAIAKSCYIGLNDVISGYAMVGSTSNVGLKGRLQTTGYNSDANERNMLAIQSNRSTGNATYWRVGRLGSSDDGTMVIANAYGRPSGTFTADNTSVGLSSVEFNTAGYLAFGTAAAAANQTTEAMRILSNQAVCIATTTQDTTSKLTVNGTCASTQANFNIISDARVKNELGPYEGGLDIITKLRPVIFRYNEKSGFGREVLDTEQVGLVADEVEAISTRSVKKFARRVRTRNQAGEMEDDLDKSFDDLRSLNLQEIQFALINAIKELDKRLTSLEK